jgi:hypothetical protein
MISHSYFSLLLCSALAILLSSLSRAQTMPLANAIAVQTGTSLEQKPVVLNTATKYTVGAIPLNVTRDLTLITGNGSGQARLECEGTCFHLLNGSSISISNMDIVFGMSAPGVRSALVFVPTTTTSGGYFILSSVIITGSKVQSHKFASGMSLQQAFPLVLHDDNVNMRNIKIQTSTINVDTLEMLELTQPWFMMGLQPFNLFAFELSSSSLFCGDRNIDCVAFDGNDGMDSVTVVNSSLAYSSAATNSFSDTSLLRVEISVDSTRRPTITIQSLTVPSGERLAVRFANSVTLENVTLSANAALSVASVDTVVAKFVTHQASSVRSDPMKFIDVRNLSMHDTTIVGFAESGSQTCGLLPVIAVATTTFSTVSNYANFTRLKAKGTFCNSTWPNGLLTGIVSVKDIANVQLADCVFDSIRTQRALMVQNASVVNVLRSRFVNARAQLPGLVRVFGADELRTELRVENTTFENVTLRTDSALFANNVVATLKGVDFSGCEVEFFSTAALTLDAANWAFSSDVLLEDVLFFENSGSGIVQIDMSSHGTTRPLQLRRVRFNGNQASNVACKLSGASNYVLESLSMFRNSAQTLLSIPDNTPITGKADRVCLCGNSASIDSSCTVMSLWIDTNVFVGSDAGCFANEARCPASVTCDLGSSTTTATVITLPMRSGTGTPNADATATARSIIVPKTTPTTSPMTMPMTTTTTTTKSVLTSATMAMTTSASVDPSISFSIGSAPNGNESGSELTTSSSTDGIVESTSMGNSSATVVMPNSAPQSEEVSVWDDPAVLGGLIGGILAFLLLLTIAVVVGVIITKRRAAASATSPATNEGDVQMTSTNSRTSNYGSIQAALPAHYGESKFASLD